MVELASETLRITPRGDPKVSVDELAIYFTASPRSTCRTSPSRLMSGVNSKSIVLTFETTVGFRTIWISGDRAGATGGQDLF